MAVSGRLNKKIMYGFVSGWLLAGVLFTGLIFKISYSDLPRSQEKQLKPYMEKFTLLLQTYLKEKQFLIEFKLGEMVAQSKDARLTIDQVVGELSIFSQVLLAADSSVVNCALVDPENRSGLLFTRNKTQKPAIKRDSYPGSKENFIASPVWYINRQKSKTGVITRLTFLTPVVLPSQGRPLVYRMVLNPEIYFQNWVPEFSAEAAAFVVDEKGEMIPLFTPVSGLPLWQFVQGQLDADSGTLKGSPPLPFSSTPETITIGEEKYVAASRKFTVPGQALWLGVALPESFANSHSSVLTTAFFFSILVYLILSGFLFYMFHIHLTEPLEMLLTRLSKSNFLDFPKAPGPGKSFLFLAPIYERLGVLFSYFKATLDQLHSRIGSIHDLGGQLSAISEDLIQQAGTENQVVEKASGSLTRLSLSMTRLNSSSKKQSNSLVEVSQAVNNINDTIQNMVEHHQHLSSYIDSTSAAIEEMTVSIEALSDMADNLNKLAGSAFKETEEGQKQIAGLMSEISGIQKQVNTNASVIKGLHQRAIRISEITQVIDEIADQTNLLALNAAIEAARAGDAGKGFAVVADEVRKLAEKTTSSTQEISQMIQDIQQRTQHAVEAMDTEQKLVEDGKEHATQIVAAFQRIAEKMNSVNSLVFNVDSSLQEQTYAAHQILRAVQEMRESSNEFTELSQSQASALEQIRITIDGIAKFSQSISDTIKGEDSNLREVVENIALLTQLLSENANKLDLLKSRKSDFENAIAEVLKQVPQNQSDVSESQGEENDEINRYFYKSISFNVL